MSKFAFYDLSGGINQSETKVVLGMDLKKIFWSDSKNVEILQNKGFIRQKGNTLFTNLDSGEQILTIHQINNKKIYNLIIITKSGKIYIFNPKSQTKKLLEKTISGNSVPH